MGEALIVRKGGGGGGNEKIYYSDVLVGSSSTATINVPVSKVKFLYMHLISYDSIYRLVYDPDNGTNSAGTTNGTVKDCVTVTANGSKVTVKVNNCSFASSNWYYYIIIGE